MHNCKTTRERFTELLLDGVGPPERLVTELRECAECREEFGGLSETLRVTTRLIESAAPPDSYWPGYHARLKERLRAAQQLRVEPGQYRADKRPWLARLFLASIRVPVPVGLAALFIFAFLVFKLRVPAEPLIVNVPVEVPVVREKTVTQVVYRESPPAPQKRVKRTPTTPKHDSTLATLQGFKPAEEVKLTVIKGGSANEK